MIGERVGSDDLLDLYPPALFRALIDAEELAEKLTDIACVACASDDAGWALTNRFGRQASAVGGFARLFPARGSFGEPKSNPGLNPQRLLGAESGGEAIGASFARRLREAVLDANTYRRAQSDRADRARAHRRYVWCEPRQAVLIASMPRRLDTANAYT